MYFINEIKFNSDCEFSNKNDLILTLKISDNTIQNIYIREIHEALIKMNVFHKNITLKDIEEKYYEGFEADVSSYFCLLSFNWVAGQASTSLIWDAKSKKFIWAKDDLFHPIGILGISCDLDLPKGLQSLPLCKQSSFLFVVYDAWWSFTFPMTHNLIIVYMENNKVKTKSLPLKEFNTVVENPGSYPYPANVKKISSGSKGFLVLENPEKNKNCKLIKNSLHCNFYQDDINNIYIVGHTKEYFKISLEQILSINFHL